MVKSVHSWQFNDIVIGHLISKGLFYDFKSSKKRMKTHQLEVLSEFILSLGEIKYVAFESKFLY